MKVFMFAVVALSASILFSEISHAVEKTNLSLGKPVAGIEFPTDHPMPNYLKNRLVLKIDEARVLVPKSTTLEDGRSGHDFPTDAPQPNWVGLTKVLVLETATGGTRRLPIFIEKAVAGVDYPTDGPADLNRDFLVWALADGLRLPLSNIAGIELAVSGLDYPTPLPNGIGWDFHVVVTTTGDRFPLP